MARGSIFTGKPAEELEALLNLRNLLIYSFNSLDSL